MSPFFRTVVLACSAGVSLVLGCGKDPVPPATLQANRPSTREDLVASLVARGDQLAAKEDSEKWRAIFPYEFAQAYSGNDPAVGKKLDAMKGHRKDSHFSLEEAKHAVWVIRNITIDRGGWPAPEAGSDLVELRMLADERLVGNLQYSEVNKEGEDEGVVVRKYAGKPVMFVAKPSLKLSEAKSAHGDPSAAKKHPDGTEVLTYGRLRVLGDKEGNVVAVLFRPDRQIAIRAAEK